MSAIKMRALLESGVHFGHNKSYRNPEMDPYIFGERQGINIINLEKTLPMMKRAVAFLAGIAASRGRILFVGTKFPARDIMRDEATRCNMPYVNHRWLGGMLTNYKTIRVSIKRLKDLEAMVDTKQYIALTKKERLSLVRERTKLDATLSGIKNMGGLPDALFIIDANEEAIAIREANRLGIPVVAVVDTNSSPKDIDYVIPGNDDSMRSILYYSSTIADAIKEARAPIELEESQKAAKQATVAKRAVKKSSGDSESADSGSADKAEPEAKGEVKTATAKPAAKVKVKTIIKAKATVKVKTTEADAATDKPKAKAKAKAKVKTTEADAETDKPKAKAKAKAKAKVVKKDEKPAEDSE